MAHWLGDSIGTRSAAALRLRFNKKILDWALSNEGYGNHQDMRVSGELFFVEKVLTPTAPKVCIDVGAFQGKYSRKLLSQTQAVIHAFEPNPVMKADLEGIKTEFPHRFFPTYTALGDKVESGVLWSNSEARDHASLAPEANEIPYVRNREETLVPVSTLDEWVSKNQISHIDLLKIDVEGFEGKVLDGAKQVWGLLKPTFVQIEFNWHQLVLGESLYSLAKRLPGYRCFQLIPGGWVERNPIDPISNVYQYSNFVFCRT